MITVAKSLFEEARILLEIFNDIFTTTPIYILVLVGLVIFYLLAVKWDTCRHLRSIWDASRRLKKLSKISEPCVKMSYLRTVDPFVFEEMILSAFKRKGWKIKRNKRYTGDGGIDGMVFYKDTWCVIQAKRYSHYISPKDVDSLSKICHKRDVKGLFIHTGKTGRKSRALENRCPRIQIISGDRLLNLLQAKQ